MQLALTQQDLANLVGASRESVNKVLGFFRRKGWIEVDERYRITVTKPKDLERQCDQA